MLKLHLFYSQLDKILFIELEEEKNNVKHGTYMVWFVQITNVYFYKVYLL